MTKKNKDSNKINTVILRTTNNNNELNMIKVLLEENNIPYIIRDRGPGGHMRIISGQSIYPSDILVEESQIERAELLIDEFPWDDL